MKADQPLSLGPPSQKATPNNTKGPIANWDRRHNTSFRNKPSVGRLAVQHAIPNEPQMNLISLAASSCLPLLTVARSILSAIQVQTRSGNTQIFLLTFVRAATLQLMEEDSVQSVRTVSQYSPSRKTHRQSVRDIHPSFERLQTNPHFHGGSGFHCAMATSWA
jgi:hypothetical protein